MRISKLLIYTTTALTITFASCKQQPKEAATKAVWYKNLLIYNLDVKVFQDSDGNGIGDFKGLTSRLDYLKSLSVTMIWLAPFQPSPNQDDGYDVTDYYGIDQRLGTMADFKAFMSEAKKRNIYVIMDMVLNHSSTEHPWFIEGSKKPASKYRNWYLWSINRPKDYNKGMGFPLRERESWTYSANARAYYFHRFYTFEPDLNFQNPQVVAESQKILGYWLNQGLDGFRLDAVPFIIDDPRKSAEQPEHDFKLLHQLARFVKSKKADAVLLGEANVEPEENKDYLSDKGEGLDMMFNFVANQYLFYALASGDCTDFKKALADTRVKPAVSQWVQFLRNHDEVDLGRLSKGHREEVDKKMGPDTSMRLYGRGIRRRLAPMLSGNIDQLKMAYSLLFSLPGTPAIRYGEEIAMGDDQSLKERLAVRTPMQWDTSFNAGFSKSVKLLRPVIRAGMYDYHKVNVQSEQQDPQSILSFIKNIASLRKQYPEIGQGDWQVLNAGTNKVLAIRYQHKGKPLLLVHNFSDKQQKAEIELKDVDNGVLNEVYNGKEHQSIEKTKLHLSLQGYAYKWYLLN